LQTFFSIATDFVEVLKPKFSIEVNKFRYASVTKYTESSDGIGSVKALEPEPVRLSTGTVGIAMRWWIWPDKYTEYWHKYAI